MSNKFKELYHLIDDSMFEALVLLYMSDGGYTVFGSDISLSGKLKYYELWNEFNGDLCLLTISFDLLPRDEQSIEAQNPGYCDYIYTQPSDEEKEDLLEWLDCEIAEDIPKFLIGIKEKVDNLSKTLCEEE